jgi:threonine dehydratase
MVAEMFWEDTLSSQKQNTQPQGGCVIMDLDTVIERIQQDIINGDVTAIYEMLKQVPSEVLIAYLPEQED